jgi:hypothetical protein
MTDVKKEQYWAYSRLFEASANFFYFFWLFFIPPEL